MKLEIEIGGRRRSVELEREGARVRCRIDGRAVEADAVEVGPGAYSILLGGQSFEVRGTPSHDGLHIDSAGREFVARVADLRTWRGKHGASVEAAGRQQIVAPMPGKVIRVLVQAGEKIEAGKGVLVVEAMKMQNEIRAPKSGTVEKLLVKEGQAVNAGEALAVII